MDTAIETYSGSGNGAPALASGVNSVLEAMGALKAFRTFIDGELKPNQDFGVIPGTGGKPTLLQPGAQKIAMFFNCYPDHITTRHELGNGHVEYIVTTSLVSRITGAKVGTGIGSCSSMESKYRYRNANRKCPKCGKEAIFKSKNDGEGFYCWRKKDGCGAIFRENDRDITGQTSGKVENENIHDQRNTVLKMAVKRSLVAASMQLGCASEMFTQDLEDIYDLQSVQAAPASPPPAAKEAQHPEDRRAEESRREVREEFRPTREAPAPRQPTSTPEPPPTGESWSQYLYRTVKTANDAWLAEMAIEGVPKEERKDLINTSQLTNKVVSRAIESGRVRASELDKADKQGVRDPQKAKQAAEALYDRTGPKLRAFVEDYLRDKRRAARAEYQIFDPEAPEEEQSQEPPGDGLLSPSLDSSGFPEPGSDG